MQKNLLGSCFFHILCSSKERITESIQNKSYCEGLQFQLVYSPFSLAGWVNIFMPENLVLLFEDKLFTLWWGHLAIHHYVSLQLYSAGDYFLALFRGVSWPVLVRFQGNPSAVFSLILLMSSVRYFYWRPESSPTK